MDRLRMGIRSRMLIRRIRDYRLLVGRHNWGKYKVRWSHSNKSVQTLDSTKAQIAPEIYVAQVTRNHSLWQTRLGFFQFCHTNNLRKGIRVPGRYGSMLKTPHRKQPYLLCLEGDKIWYLPDHWSLTIGNGLSLTNIKEWKVHKNPKPAQLK